MLVFRNGLWKVVEVPADPMLSYVHRQRLAAGKKENALYAELFPGLRYPSGPDQASFGKSIAPQSTTKNKPV